MYTIEMLREENSLLCAAESYTSEGRFLLAEATYAKAHAAIVVNCDLHYISFQEHPFWARLTNGRNLLQAKIREKLVMGQIGEGGPHDALHTNRGSATK